MGTPVIIKIQSTQRDMIGASLFSDALINGADAEDILEDADFFSEDGTYELTTGGEFDFSEKVTVRYREDALSEDGECMTEISFSPDDPKSITVTRTGAQMSIFLIEEGKRQISVYKTPYGPLEMCTYARRVDNKISDEGGTLILDYAVELRGMTAQKTKMKVEIKTK